MTVFYRRVLILLALILAVGSFALAEEMDGAFPEMNDDGFLDSGEFVFEDPENGVWRYASSTLWIEIYRYEQQKPARVWYEAEIRCTPESAPRMVCSDPEHWKTVNEWPHKIARKTGIPTTKQGRQRKIERIFFRTFFGK